MFVNVKKKMIKKFRVYLSDISAMIHGKRIAFCILLYYVHIYYFRSFNTRSYWAGQYDCGQSTLCIIIVLFEMKPYYNMNKTVFAKKVN